MSDEIDDNLTKRVAARLKGSALGTLAHLEAIVGEVRDDFQVRVVEDHKTLCSTAFVRAAPPLSDEDLAKLKRIVWMVWPSAFGLKIEREL